MKLQSEKNEALPEHPLEESERRRRTGKQRNRKQKEGNRMKEEARQKEGQSMTAADRKEALLQLQEQIRECRHCEELFGYAPRPVVYGHPGARILHVSQAPGRMVHASGIPFSDPSGKTLRNAWYQISEEDFYNPDLFYFTVMAHCFPGKGNNNYDRRPPACCWNRWTKQEVELMTDCELVLVVGQEAASRLFPGRKLQDLVFEDLTWKGKPCFVLPHPSPLNRRWLKEHPAFEEERLPKIRAAIHDVLDRYHQGT